MGLQMNLNEMNETANELLPLVDGMGNMGQILEML